MTEGAGVERELKTEQAIFSRFQDLRNELATLSGRANELAAESQEHDLVLKALEPLDGGRRCYRVVGDVLVERTVAEVVPAVKGNKGQLDAVVERLVKTLEEKKQKLSDFQEKYKIRIRDDASQSAADQQQQEQQQADSKKSNPGVLIT